MRKRFVVMLPALLLAPGSLSAQSAQAETAAQVQTPQARIDAAIAAAARANIPRSLIESKIAEGRAKAVPQERIAAAVEARVAALVRAAETLARAHAEAHDAGELSVTADALEAGVSENALIRISRDAPATRRTVAVAVLADLVRLGRPSEHAFNRVNAAMRSNAALANLNAEVSAQLRRQGLGPTNRGNGVGPGGNRGH